MKGERLIDGKRSQGEVPDPRILSLRVPGRLVTQLDELADRERVSRARFVVSALEATLQQEAS